MAEEETTIPEEETTDTKPITTDEELKKVVGDIAAGIGTNIPKVDAVKMGETTPVTLTEDQKMSDTGGVLVGDVADTDKKAVDKAANVKVTAPTRDIDPETGAYLTTPGQIDSTSKNVEIDTETGKQKIKDVDEMATAKLATTTTDADGNVVPIEYVDMTGVEGSVSTGSIADEVSDTVDEQSTVKYQIGQLMESLEEGKPMPAWASPAIRKVGAIMQARGMGGSSMAAAAITQAMMESGIPIATADANTYATMELQNLNNKQATTLQNAATYAAMDKANLNARLQAAVTNAQSLLAVDTANLTAEQATNTVNYNALTTALFKDTASDNARKEINAKNELQLEEFYVELGSQVETANANREVAVNQFNSGEDNAMNQFFSSQADSRDKFDATMQFAIDQSNVNWRRQINTADTAVANETNRINAQNLYNSTTTAMNALWQKYRDNASWNFSKSESAEQRAHEIGVMAMEFANSKETYTQEQKDTIGLAVGDWLATWIAAE